MSSLLKRSAGAFAVVAALMGSASVEAAVLYNNGPLNGTVNGIEIAGGYAVSELLHLDVCVGHVYGIDFGVWTIPGDTLSTVDWGITATPRTPSTAFIASGTAPVLDGHATLNMLRRLTSPA